MVKRLFVLTELEDLALVACDDQHLPALVARDIIASWLKRRISVREMRAAYAKLLALGLLQSYRERAGRVYVAPFEGTRTRDLSFRATPKGRRHLQKPRNVV
jgi:hypothetical protein